LQETGVEVRAVENFRHECGQRLRIGLQAFCHPWKIRGECRIFGGAANHLGNEVDRIRRVTNVVRDCIEEPRLANARFLGFVPGRLSSSF
jgi:hypothetical protein